MCVFSAHSMFFHLFILLLFFIFILLELNAAAIYHFVIFDCNFYVFFVILLISH